MDHFIADRRGGGAIRDVFEFVDGDCDLDIAASDETRRR